jgi:hypothetical protein
VHPCAPESLRIAQPAGDRCRSCRARGQHARSRHRREVPDHRRHRHVLEEGLPDLGRGQVLTLQRFPGQSVLADERGRLPGRARRLGADEALDERRQSIGVAAADDPVEEPSVVGAHLERRVSGADAGSRVCEPQEVSVRHSVPLPVLHRLVGERVHRLRRVPATHRPPERAAPAAEALDEGRELEEMRARARDPRQCVERRTPRCVVAEARGHRQGEERRIVLGRPALRADADDLFDRPQAVLGEAVLDRAGVLTRQCRLGGVVAAAFRAEDEEATQSRPGVDLPGVAACGVRNLTRARQRRRLGRPPRAQGLEVGHLTPPFRVCCCGRVVAGRI